MSELELDVYTTSAQDSVAREAKLISRILFGTFWEAPILHVEKVYIDVYKIDDGFILNSNWDWTCIHVSAAKQAQNIIEHVQDTWKLLPQQFNMD